MTAGIGIIVPCYNAAKRLPQTLAHIAAQQVSRDLQWEVVIIDSASTDNTGDVALSCWPAGGYGTTQGFASAIFCKPIV